jgi:hypothetical protein
MPKKQTGFARIRHSEGLRLAYPKIVCLCILQAMAPNQRDSSWHEVCRSNPVRNALVLAVIFATGLSVPGCNKSEGTVKQSFQSNAEFNYTYDKREVFIADASADLKELDQKINELSGNAMSASAEVKAVAESKIDNLRKQRVALGKKLNELGSANASNWNKLKADYQKLDFQMKVSLRDSWQWINDHTRS